MVDHEESMAQENVRQGSGPELVSEPVVVDTAVVGTAVVGAAVDGTAWNALHDRSMPWPMGWGEKLLLGFLTLCMVAAFAILAIQTDPDPRGLGTHEQLGMEPCGWLQGKGYPCPTCGCTTAASLLVHMRPGDAFLAQPFGAILALAAMAFGLLALMHIYRGRSLFARLAFWPWFRVIALGVAILLGSWYYIIQTWQQSH